MLRQALLAASGNAAIRNLVTSAPVSREVVRRFVAGEDVADAMLVVRRLLGEGLKVTLDRLGEDTTDVGRAETTTKAYIGLLARLADEGLACGAEVSVKLSAVGQRLDESVALDNARAICAAAAVAETTVTLDMEDHTTTDSTLRILRALREEWPWVGAVIQSYLHRSLDDCRELAGPGSRVRLCKGAYQEPDALAFQAKHDVDLAFVRCLRVLMHGDGFPMVATHDPRLLRIAAALAQQAGRGKQRYEFQMLYGIRPDEQRRLVRDGATVRVYVPYGEEWYAYFMRRLAERPANVAFFLRALATRG